MGFELGLLYPSLWLRGSAPRPRPPTPRPGPTVKALLLWEVGCEFLILLLPSFAGDDPWANRVSPSPRPHSWGSGTAWVEQAENTLESLPRALEVESTAGEESKRKGLPALSVPADSALRAECHWGELS